MAMGNAVTADPPGIESIHFNPAGLARLTGTHQIDTVFVASIRNPNKFVSAPDIDIGGFKDDPINGMSSGPVRQAVAIPFIGIPKARLPGWRCRDWASRTTRPARTGPSAPWSTCRRR
jgi:hypothetical protein